MAANTLPLTFFGIHSFFSDYPKGIKRGEISFKSNHVIHRNYDPITGRIDGIIQASIKKLEYKVWIQLNDDGTVESACCSCPRGNHKCHHMAALMLQTVNTLSSTDKLCSWRIPSKKPSAASVKSIKEMFPQKKHNIINHDVTPEDKEVFRKLLNDKGDLCPFMWLLSPEPSYPDGLPQTIDDILGSQEFVQAINPRQSFLDQVKLTPQQIETVEVATRGQSVNPNWGMFRKGRITSSNFAICLRNRKPVPSTMKTLLGQYDISGLKSVQYGLHHEKVLVESYERHTKSKVHDCGVFLSSSGVLGASQDGIIDQDILVEVKCPLSLSEKTVEEALASGDFYLKRQPSDEVAFNWQNPSAKKYYDQMQGQMYLARRTKCDFVIWTPKECQIFRIAKDASWYPNLQKLEDFYMTHFYPALTQQLL